jgi:hypothetical protein
VSGIPNPMTVNSKVSGSFGSVGPVTLAGLPDTYHLNVDTLPKIQLGTGDDEIKTHSTLDPLDVTTHVSIERIPDIRAHLPADYSVGLSLLGVELLCIRLCGEGQLITEPYHPNPCEVCGQPHRGELSERETKRRDG